MDALSVTPNSQLPCRGPNVGKVGDLRHRAERYDRRLRLSNHEIGGSSVALDVAFMSDCECRTV
jgi:hypothetical protein